jgi:hypothetical protein
LPGVSHSPLNDDIGDDTEIIDICENETPVKSKKKILEKILSAKKCEQEKINLAHSQDYANNINYEKSIADRTDKGFQEDDQIVEARKTVSEIDSN